MILFNDGREGLKKALAAVDNLHLRRAGDRKSLVIGVAIKRGDVVFYLPRPKRHHDLIKEMAEIGVKPPIGHGTDVQGFMTIYGFRDRARTWAAIGKPQKIGRVLTSEDLW